MTEHLTEQQIESFHRRKMSPEGLRTAHQHLATCEMCRQRLSTPGQVAFAFAAFERELQHADAEEEHLHYQQLSGYVDDDLREIEREIVESHLDSCETCAAEVRDLRAFKSTITATEDKTVRKPSSQGQSLSWWNRPALWTPVRWAVAVIAIVLILTAAILLLRSRVSHQDQAQLTQAPSPSVEATPQSSPVIPTPSTPPQVNIGRESPQAEKQLNNSRGTYNSTASSPIVVTLNDGERVVTLDSRGRISGVEAGVPGVQRLVAAALLSERLEKPPILDRLIREPSRQLDVASQNSSFALQRPVGTVVQSDRPTFIWGPVDGASGYIVSVFDARLKEVARSDALSTTTWMPPRALQRGGIYRWQVIAVKDGREIVLPSPTAPEAKFKVLEQQQAQALIRARQRYANSHLALGVLYAQRGLLDDAETELQALVKENPTSTVARKLLENLQAWRADRRKPPESGARELRQ